LRKSQFFVFSLQLREAFKKGIIKPGMNVQLLPEKTFANNIVRKCLTSGPTKKIQKNYFTAKNEGEAR
jgi:hypothetical protein